MIKKVEGLIIRDLDYGDTSKIIYLLTKEYGQLSVIAKGVKSLKSKLRGVTMKLTYGYFHIYYKEDKLSILAEVDVIDNLLVIKKDLTRLSYASFICNLVGQVIKQAKEEEKEVIYTSFINSLLKINEGYDPLVITNILEFKLLDYLGVKPIIDRCVKCGNTNSIVTISSRDSGFLCSKCYQNETLISSKSIKFLRMFSYLDIAKISKLKISEEVKHEINNFINIYYQEHTGLYLDSKNFLEEIK
ncbi:MAG: DNA repair protein RecO [Bacilli bacterium]|jgi:DNA repair protein RecO (recombination protein O)